ncbi:G2/mitotic-specific cyclin-B3 [Copidosoma floridanum]|uniref:G2/mitotic-specific cyclin-B3 n=1 Tax=Copidosoma floridanum TaxID=29053 RepID=UPI0006C97A6E|nr:G2/mitotic-specific cyclin-B3 [Copidosoma floridanum]XP_014204081.1 G2/mitotic-specific cyclin-B3 [Copidosoma floridanum]XP_014204157.1 G2/mitotic-specific cyclin-B3 [Copidosoma floridanum]
MAPPKAVTSQTSKVAATTIITGTQVPGVMTRRGLVTRQQNINTQQIKKQQPLLIKDTRNKRKADVSPVKEKMTKRSALGNITNAIGKTISAQIQDASKKVAKKVTIGTSVKTIPQPVGTSKTVDSKVVPKPDSAQNKSKQVSRIKQITKKEEKTVEVPLKTVNLRRSFDAEKSDESSLYVSALETLPEEGNRRLSRTLKEVGANKLIEGTTNRAAEVVTAQTELTSGSSVCPLTENKNEEEISEKPEATLNCNIPPVRSLPENVQWDFDVENWQDPYQVPQYAMDIFDYLKEREKLFPINDYMEHQVCLSRWMRSLLVDWMVAVQESFELNHETLYLAVKLVDLYLCKVTVSKETLQLLGAASLFIASKFDERIPPMIEDFLYICDSAYNHKELTRMEINVLKVMDFDLGIPLSYRFLRRYARCAKVTMPTLTLARYILEYSLMDYATISCSDSKMAAAALFLALQMKDLGGWTPTLEYYTGYKLADFSSIVLVLNEGLHRKHKEALSTVRNKYSHKIFFEVAKVPLKEKLDI